LLTRTIPASVEPLPVIGCGTYVGFDQATSGDGYRSVATLRYLAFAGSGINVARTSAGTDTLDDRPVSGTFRTYTSR
jgi:hypothetical protein